MRVAAKARTTFDGRPSAEDIALRSSAAGVAQRQSRWLPPRRCEFDSRHPLQLIRPSSSGPGHSPFKRDGRGSNPLGRTISLPLRLTAGRRTLNAAIVVRIHEGERRCSSAEERRSHTAKGGCSNQPTGTNFESELIPAVVQWSERLNVNQEVGGSTPSPGTNSDHGGRMTEHGKFRLPFVVRPPNGGVAQRKSGGLQNRVSAGSIPASPAILLRADALRRTFVRARREAALRSISEEGRNPGCGNLDVHRLPFTDFFR
jgi:hypothetical protein